MIKDKLTEAVEAGLKSIKNGDDHIPLNMRGELEVTVKDRDGNVISYERGHNQVTNLAKMAIIHLLAGEIGVVDNDMFSIAGGEDNPLYRTYSLTEPESELPYAKINSSFIPGNHTVSQNLDGVLVSEEQYFYDGAKYLTDGTNINQLSQVMPKDVSGVPLKFNFPTKMLFGTGMEARNDETAFSEYTFETGERLNVAAINRLNGYDASGAQLNGTFWSGLNLNDGDADFKKDKLSNWYSNNEYRARTLQPSTADKLETEPNSTATSVKGAIKNCYITLPSQSSRYNGATKMAYADFRGYGFPCFIYAKRSTQRFYWNREGNLETYYNMNTALGTTSPYETEITYTVVMPSQPINSTEVTTFYPYNGWILKQAGLFSDSRYKLRSEEADTTSPYRESVLLSVANSGAVDGSTYRDSVGGQLLFTRNLSSPILKTPDNQVVFNWHIFITI